jgi:NAD-dependent SIR2 family protein deacetylase
MSKRRTPESRLMPESKVSLPLCVSCKRLGHFISEDSLLPLCEECLIKTEEISDTEWFRSSYCCPHVVLETKGSVLQSMLQSITLPPASSIKPEEIQPSTALDLINADLTAPLLILTGAGTSVSYGITPGYGPPYAEDVHVNDKYWGVFSQTTQVTLAECKGQGQGQGQSLKKVAHQGFYSRLAAFVADQSSHRPAGCSSLCIATSNIDGLCPTGIGGIKLLELHGSVIRTQCSGLTRDACRSTMHESKEITPSASASKSKSKSNASGNDSRERERSKDNDISISRIESLGTCPHCQEPLRFNVTGFTDYPSDVLETQSAQKALREWVDCYITAPSMTVLCIGCSDHVHSMVHEARAVAYARHLRVRSAHDSTPPLTRIIVVNPDSAAAESVGEDCLFVKCGAEELFAEQP